MTQCCNVYINIMCDEEDKSIISSWLKNYFNKPKNLNMWDVPLNYIEIIDDAKELIVLDLEIEVPCSYIGGYPGSRWEPPEPAYIIDYFDEIDFLDWIKKIIPKEFNIDIEIDTDSNIPSEEKLIKEFEEGRLYV